MDKKALQEQFEAIAIQNCWNINKYPAGWDGHGDDEYADDFVSGAWWGFQHQQAKVEELQRRNQMLNDNIKEQGQKLVYQNEVIETQAEKLLGLRDEKAELQKRVDKAIRLLVEAELYQSEPNIDLAVKALKGEGHD